MSQQINVTVHKIAVHILDTSLSQPIFSTIEPNINQDLQEFLEEHLSKILTDNSSKRGEFTDEATVKNCITEMAIDKNSFLRETINIASSLFNIMVKHPSIPSGDAVFSMFMCQDKWYIGIFKFNYRESFIHQTNEVEGEIINSIVKYRSTLPGKSQKADEYAVISLEDFSIQLFDKLYEINGEKKYYFSEDFLECQTSPSEVEVAKALKKHTETFNKNFCNKDIQVSDSFNKALLDNVEEATINIEEISERVFKNSELRETYLAHLEKKGFPPKVHLKEEVIEKIFSKRKIKTDNGIEINLTIDSQDNHIEYINNPDGTMSILIKNINSISYK